jgi:hypothetical protein
MSRPIEVWTEDVCAALREHWGKMPASRIGKILFGRDDAGNAVIAKRIGCSSARDGAPL